MMIGATPAKFTYSGCTTPRAMPAATPASIALPPASRILKPASAARYWQAATMWRVPMMVGRWAFMVSSRYSIGKPDCREAADCSLSYHEAAILAPVAQAKAGNERECDHRDGRNE